VGARRSARITGTIVVVEIAVTLVLLAGAGLMVRSFLKLYSFDLGYRTENLMVVRLELLSNKYRGTDMRRTFYDQIVQQVRTIPGVETVALTTSVPPAGAPSVFFEIEGHPPTATVDNPPEAMVVSISPGFFDVLNLRVRTGRTFTDADGVRGDETILINERLAQRYFAGENPIGQRIRWVWRVSSSDWQSGAWRRIVGVSPTLQHRWPDRADHVIYTPHRQEAEPSVMLLVRSQAEPAMLMRAVQLKVLALDQDQPVFMAQTIDQMLARRRWTFVAFGSLLVVFAVIAVLMAAVGVYAVMTYSVAQRTQEIAVRMALGAGAGQVSWLVLRRGLIQLGIGVVVGNLGALATTRLVTALLVQVTPTDSLTLVTITALLAAVAVAACLIPARRATHTDVLTALRAE
jgi:putative ABC transport system permease protein